MSTATEPGDRPPGVAAPAPAPARDPEEAGRAGAAPVAGGAGADLTGAARPRAGRLRAHSPTVGVPVGVGAAALVVLLEPVAGLALLGVLLLLVLVDALLIGGPGTATRSAPDLVARGTSHPLEIDVAPTARATVRQPLPAGLRAEPDTAPAEDGLRATLHADRRGAYLLPPVVVRRLGPLRLVRRDREVGEPHRLDVYPDFPAAARIAAAVRAGRVVGGERRRGPLGMGTEFEAVRDYVPDDDVRQINWLATWRTGRPMSNQYRVESERDVLLLLDCGRVGAAPGAPGATLLDACLDALTAVAAVADELGDRTGVVAFDGGVRVQQPPVGGGGARAVRALHAARSAPVDADYAAAFRIVAPRRRAFVLLLTDLVEPAAPRTLREAVPILRRRHALHVASPRDPRQEELLATPPTTLLEAAVQSAAADDRADRDEAATELAAAGVRSLSAPPGELGAACVRAYLLAKHRATF